MGSPFRSDEHVQGERIAELEKELAEVDDKLEAALTTQRGLERRAHPFFYTLFTPPALLWVLFGIALGVAIHLYQP